MALTKEIMGQSTVQAFRLDDSKGSFYLKLCTKQQHRISLSPTFYCSDHTTKDQKKVMNQTVSSLPTFIEAKSREAVAWKPVLETALVTVTATVTLKNSKHVEKEMMSIMLQHFKAFNRSATAKGMVMQLVSTEVDPRTMEPKVSKTAVLEWKKNVKVGASKITYKVEFEIDSDFGLPGAISVVNKYEEEFFLEDIVIEGILHFSCNSWVQPEKIYPEKRVFFTDKVRLPWETPAGLRELRKQELRQARGDGRGVRKHSDRIYDYDVYNDLGNSDKTRQDSRPIFGGHQYPYPRRCRTGRPPSVHGDYSILPH